MSSSGSQLVTIEDVADRLNVSPRTVRRWASEGRIQAVRLSERKIRFDPAAIDRFIAEATT